MVNLANTNEHIIEIKQWIQVVKERSQASHHSLPCQWIPKLLMIHLVLNAVKILNFPTKEEFPTLSAERPLCLERLLTTRNTWVSKLDNTVRCIRKIPQAIAKVQELRVPFCLDPVVTSKEDTSSWLWIPERKLLSKARMWFPCKIWPLLMWMHWEMTNLNN
jgi:hypothetical protein